MTVVNVAPTVNAGADQATSEGTMISLDPAAFNDLGTADAHTATIDWGDGSAVATGAVSESWESAQAEGGQGVNNGG